MKPKKSWREKLADDKGLTKVAEVADKMSNRWGEGKMVVPAPIEVDAEMGKGKRLLVRDYERALFGGLR